MTGTGKTVTSSRYEVILSPGHDALEAWLLERLPTLEGIYSLVREGCLELHCFVPSRPEIDALRKDLETVFPEVVLRMRAVREENWTEYAQRQWKPLFIGQFCVIPPWLSCPDESRIPVVITPNQAFGTGLHPSTQQCLRWISDVDLSGARVLDVGTGTGILAVASAKAGADVVVALDPDEQAIRECRENVQFNQVMDRVHIVRGTLEGIRDWQVDAILMNLEAKVLIQEIRLAPQVLRKTGTVVVAGFMSHQKANVAQSLAAAGLRVVYRSMEADWVLWACEWTG